MDAYLNVNEALFDFDGLIELLQPSGLQGFLVYGITADKYGCLLETRVTKGKPMLPVTDLAAHLQSPFVQEAYERLTLADKYRLIDLLFRPNGYTIMAFTAGAARHWSSESRIGANALMLSGG